MSNIKPIRTAEWSVSADLSAVTPSGPVPAGVQGEDNATLAIFHLGRDSLLADPAYGLYAECITAAGEYDKTQPLTVTPEGDVNIPIPLAWTQYGGETTMRLVAEQDGQIVYTVEGRMSFASRSTAAHKVDGLLRTYIQQTLDKSQQWADAAKSSADTAISAAGQANQCALEAHNDAAAVEENGKKVAQAVAQVQAAANAAAASANRADGHACTATEAAGRAEQAAKDSETAAASASASEQNTGNRADESAASAAAAQASEKAASASEQAALASANAASQSAASAESSAGALSTAAANAAASASAAASAATRAETAAENAGAAAEQAVGAHAQDPAAHGALFAAKAEKTYVDSSFASAIRNTVSGSAIYADDVSPVGHSVGCTVSSVNKFDAARIIPGKNAVTPHETGFTITNNGDAQTYIYADIPGVTKHVTLSFDYEQVQTVTTCSALILKKGSSSILYNSKTFSAASGKMVITATIPEGDEGVRIFLYNNNTGTKLNASLSLSHFMLAESGAEVPFVPCITDLTKIRVRPCGKNLVGEASLSAAYQIYKHVYLKANTTYTASCEGPARYIAVIRERDNAQVRYKADTAQYTFSVSADGLHTLEYGITKDRPFAQCQLEYGSAKTGYVPAMTACFAAGKEGAVGGMSSLSPVMSLLPDTEGVTLHAAYHADTKRYIDKKFAELKAVTIPAGSNV